MLSLRPVALCIPLLLIAACGDAIVSDDSSTTSTASAAPDDTALLQKPEVQLPTELPTELVITDLTTGAGPAAEVGDVVMVHYVGVRSATGEEFDNSYDRGEPIEVTLGSGGVIAGWEQGLLGAQQGGRRQLDIPADLAYGDTPQEGSIIQPGDALSFIVDVVVVLHIYPADDEPDITLEPAANIDEVQSTELVEGDGDAVQEGQNVAILIVSFRADTGERLVSGWGELPLVFLFSADTDVYPGLLQAVSGMSLGERRQSQIPAALIFDGLGNEGLGLPEGVDLTVVLDLIAVY